MKGFLKRDLYLLTPHAGFYLLCIALLLIFTVAAQSNSSFLNLYATIFCASSLLGLFSYDTANCWQGYAAAMPNGRRAQVQGRYALAVLLCGGITALMMAASFVSGRAGGWALALLQGGMLLVYVDIMFPLSYRFGMQSRLIMFVLLVILAGGIGVGGSMAVMAEGPNGDKSIFAAAAVPLVLAGLVGVAISYRISVAIMAKKEL